MGMTDKIHAYPEEAFSAGSGPTDQPLEQMSAAVEALVVAAQAGCHVAFEKLHSLYSRRLYRTIFSITRSPQDAEEALQDTFLRAFLAIKTFEGKSKVYTWLTRIAVNSALMVLRKRRSRLEVLLDPQPDGRSESPAFDVKDTAPSPEEILDLSQRQHRTLRAISRLKPYLRTPLRMQVMRGLSIKEISRDLNISEASVKSRLYRARQQLTTSRTGFFSMPSNSRITDDARIDQ